MVYQKIGRAPGSLLPRTAQENLMRNPGQKQNYEIAESLLLREHSLLKNLVRVFLDALAIDKAKEHWNYFQEQWKANIVNYVKNINGVQHVGDMEIDQYKHNFKYKTVVRLVQEYVLRLEEFDQISQRYPNIPPENNKLLFGTNRQLKELHDRLMTYWKELKNPEPSAILR